jgi:type I restriction enzyme S subunit
MGQSPDSSSCNDLGFGLPFLQGCGEFGDKYPIVKNYCHVPKKISPKNSILISVRAPVGDINLANQDFVIGRGLAGIVAKDIDRIFLYYSIIQFKKQLWRVSQGSTFEAINSQNLHDFEIKSFSSEEQRKIARILSTCDEVIEKTEAAIAKYQALKQGMMHDLFTRGIDINTGKLRPSYQDGPELYKESQLGMIPKEWEVKRLENFLSLKSGDGITSTDINDFGEYPVYGGNGLRGFTNSYTHEGDYVLIGRQGALCGNITLSNGKIYASEHAVVVTIIDDSHVKWVEYKLRLMNLNQYSEASAQPGLSVGKIAKLHVKIPLGKEQVQIAKRFSSIENRINTEQKSVAKFQQLKAGLMQDLLTGKVEVNVGEEE